MNEARKQAYKYFFGDECRICEDYGVTCDNIGFLYGRILGGLAVAQVDLLLGLRFTSEEERSVLSFTRLLRFGSVVTSIEKKEPFQACPVLVRDFPPLLMAYKYWELYRKENGYIPDDVLSNFPWTRLNKKNW